MSLYCGDQQHHPHEWQLLSWYHCRNTSFNISSVILCLCESQCELRVN